MVSNKILKIMCDEMITELKDCIDILSSDDCIGLDDKWNTIIVEAYKLICEDKNNN